MALEPRACRVCRRAYFAGATVATITEILLSGHSQITTVTTVEIGPTSSFRLEDCLCPACHLSRAADDIEEDEEEEPCFDPIDFTVTDLTPRAEDQSTRRVSPRPDS